MLHHRAERNSLESSLFEAQRLTTQLQTQQEQLEGKAETAQLARRALQGAAVGGLCPRSQITVFEEFSAYRCNSLSLNP